MKIVDIVPRLLCTFFFVGFCLCVSAQTVIEGYVLDSISKKPLPYAAIIFGESRFYTTSNEDGKFRILTNEKMDSIAIRYLGYNLKKVSKDYFLSNTKVYLRSAPTALREVVVEANVSKKNRSSNKESIVDLSNEYYLHELLFELIQKYRKNEEEIKSKAYFTLTSKAQVPVKKDTAFIPLEQIEALYNSKHKLSEGVVELNLKTGRFGQNQDDPFYSLDYIEVLKNLALFKRGFQILPEFPGNMSLRKIKRIYQLQLVDMENYDGLAIAFVPKVDDGTIFSGKILFQENDLLIEKIELSINKPRNFKLMPLVNKDEVSLHKIDLKILFNPVDLRKIQYYDFGVEMTFKTEKIEREIESEAVLYLYDYYDDFDVPHFTNSIEFKNDYDSFLALTASNEIWEAYYPYPLSERNTEVFNFFKDKQQLYSYYENQIPQDALEHIKTSSINWSPKSKLQSRHIRLGPGVNLNFSYALNHYQTLSSNYKYTSSTLFDIQASYFKSRRTPKDLACINLAFDIYESNRRAFMSKITDQMTLQEVNALCDAAALQSNVTIKLMFDQCLSELSSSNYNRWRDQVDKKLMKYAHFGY